MKDVGREPPFVEFKAGDRDANDRHYLACERERRPMVMVKLKRKYAELEWDCFTLGTEAEQHVRGRRGDLLLRGMFKSFQTVARGKPSRPFFDESAFTGWIKNLLPDDARRLALEYYSLLAPGGEMQRAATVRNDEGAPAS